eukprot:4057837-Pleurochrysis_carterae.AAC.5
MLVCPSLSKKYAGLGSQHFLRLSRCLLSLSSNCAIASQINDAAPVSIEAKRTKRSDQNVTRSVDVCGFWKTSEHAARTSQKLETEADIDPRTA